MGMKQNLTRALVLKVAEGLERQTIGSRVVAIEILRELVGKLPPDPPHNCECSECDERGDKLLEWHRLYNDLKDCLPPGFVITLCGRPVDHTQINNALSRLDNFVRGR